MRVAVIGAGLGGLAAAIRLSAAGAEVELFEQSAASGGKAGVFSAEGYRFDTGPSLLTMPFVFERLFNEAGALPHERPELVALEPLSRNFFADGSVLDDSCDLSNFERSLRAFSARDAENLRRYLDSGRRMYEATAGLFLFGSIQETLRHGGLRFTDLVALARLDSLRTVHRANRAFFRDPRVVQLFDRYATFNGSNPYRAPATLLIIPAVVYGFGGFTVKGGIAELPRAFESLARRLGVTFHHGSRVERIRIAHGRARGVTVGGTELAFDAVVSNADIRSTYHDLMPDAKERLARRSGRLPPSTSGLVFLWGMRSSFPELAVGNLFFPRDYGQEFKDLFERRRCPTDPTAYVSITSKVNPGDAPKGRENWFVLVNAPADSGQDWTAETERVRSAVLHRLSLALNRNVGELIEVEKVLTPRDLERNTSSTHGSLYGSASNSPLSAFFRHPNRHPRIQGLYFCGGSSHPGGGMPLATLSGMTAADLLLKYERGADA